MSKLKGSKTEGNLKAAFAGESQANRRYLYFAQKADVEGYNDVSAVFRSTAEGETGHAHGHLEYLESVGDPATGLPIGSTSQNLKAAIATSVGPSAARSRPSGCMVSSSKWPLSIDIPAGFGAFAITVSPPPVTAPATSAYLNSSLNPSTSEPR